MSNIHIKDKLSAARQDESDFVNRFNKLTLKHVIQIVILSAFTWFVTICLMNTVLYLNDIIFNLFKKNHPLFFLLIFTVAILRSYLYHKPFFKGAFGDGATDTIKFLHNTYAKDRTKKVIKNELMTLQSITLGLKRVFITILTIGLGGSGGLEGPAIPIGESFGRGFAKYFQLASIERFRIFQMCGIAAAISTLLHAPLTGCIFACEVVFAGHFIYPFIIYGMVGSLTAFILSNHLLDHSGFLLITVNHGQAYSMQEYLYIVITSSVVSIPSGLGLIFILKWIRHIMSSLNSYLHAPLGALVCYVTALILFKVYDIPPETILGVGEDFIRDVYNGTLEPALNFWSILALIAIAKIILTAFTIISGGSAGMLVPSILVGSATTASLYHGLILLGMIHPSATTYSLFIISGIASSLICVMDLPIATIIFIGETFGRPYFPAAIVSVIIARFISIKIKKLTD